MGTPRLLGDAILVTTVTAGTGTYTLGSAVTGHFHPDDFPLVSGGRYSYVAVDSLDAPTIKEVGEGILTDGGASWTLTRASITKSLSGGVAGGSAINWSAGTKYIFLTNLAANTPQYDTEGALPGKNVAKVMLSWNGSTINDSFGVTSVTDHGTGDFTINFAATFADLNYMVVASASLLASDGATLTVQQRSDSSQRATTSARFNVGYGVAGRTLVDAAYTDVLIFGDLA